MNGCGQKPRLVSGFNRGFCRERLPRFLFSETLFSSDPAGAGIARRLRRQRNLPALDQKKRRSKIGRLADLGLRLDRRNHHSGERRHVWFVQTPTQISRTTYQADPFPEAEVVANYIRDNSTPSARVAVIGSEPEIYFLSRRHSATSYIYTYGLLEPQPFARQRCRTK